MPRADRAVTAAAVIASLAAGCAEGLGESAARSPSGALLDPRETPYAASPPARPPATPATPAPRASVARAPAAPPEPLPPEVRMDRLLAGGGAALKAVMAAPDAYRFQVLYAPVHEGPPPSLERHGFRADAEYFFPASSMKVPIALAAYERLPLVRSETAPAYTRDATLRIHPLSGRGEPYVTTLARETWRALIVSDNVAANRILGVVGHREAHETLWSLGLASARIRTGFATGAEIDPAELSPRIDVVGADGATQEIAPRRSDLALPPTDAVGLAVGRAAIVDGRLVPGPLSFAEKNAMRLRDLQDALVRIVRPDLLPAGSKGDTASKDDLAYLKKALGTLPSQSGLAGFERNVVADYQLIPFLRGVERVKPRDRFEIYTKVGQAYGFLVANAYVVDKDTRKSFFLAATVYADPDETINDDTYAYDTIAFPALADVGEAFARDAFAR
jgi:hypothetical protein